MTQGLPMRHAYCPDADILEIGLGVDAETRAVALDDQTFVHLRLDTGDVVGFTVMNLGHRSLASETVTVMARDHRYTVHFLVAKDGDQYSALCYEFTTGGCGPDERSALDDAISATVTYLEYLIDEGREADAYRPASAKLIATFLDLPTTDSASPCSPGRTESADPSRDGRSVAY